MTSRSKKSWMIGVAFIGLACLFAGWQLALLGSSTSIPKNFFSCRLRHGNWTDSAPFNRHVCVITLNDGGKLCQADADCLAGCQAQYLADNSGYDTNAGRCAGHLPLSEIPATFDHGVIHYPESQF